MSQRVLDLGAVGSRQALAGRAPDVEGREALLGVATVELELTIGQCQEQVMPGELEGTLLDQQIGQRPVRAMPVQAPKAATSWSRVTIPFAARAVRRAGRAGGRRGVASTRFPAPAGATCVNHRPDVITHTARRGRSS